MGRAFRPPCFSYSMSICPNCKIRPRVVYPSRKRAQGYCKECWSDRANAWNKKNRDHVRDKAYRRKFKGLTLEDYNRKAESQNFVCAICCEPCVSGKELAVDHNHQTLKNRGLLCVRCNNGIGQLQESPAIIQRAIEYLNTWKTIHANE